MDLRNTDLTRDNGLNNGEEVKDLPEEKKGRKTAAKGTKKAAKEAGTNKRRSTKERTAERLRIREQDKDMVFALDIGTRSIVGIVGRAEEGKLHVLAVEAAEHGKRAMLDGQIENIEQVAEIAKQVIKRLEERLHVRLRRVCVAAAGRALQSAKASYTMEFSESRQVGDELVNQLEAGALAAAEANIVDEGQDSFFYMVGYSAAQYRLDGYPMQTLQGHWGQRLEVDVVATFLPREVVDSLYTVVARLGLEVASLTLEPIASLNAAIPVDIRLLNLVLVDIGAGTSDIAVCRDGSVAGYTMATVAGDEVTELLMKKLLVDFKTGEQLKQSMGLADPLQYEDILGLGHECALQELCELIQPAVQLLAGEIAGKIMELNGVAPSAVFLAGGGSKLYGLRKQLAEQLGMEDSRVAIAGNHFAKTAFAEELELNDPEYSTPLGIAVSAALGMINDSYVVTLNGSPAKLFRSGTLTIRDILLMNGCRYGDMMGRTGANLTFMVNGQRHFLRGETYKPAVIRLNGEEAELSAVVNAGDSVEFEPAKPGRRASCTPAELLGEDFAGEVRLLDPDLGEKRLIGLDYQIRTGDALEVINPEEPEELDEADEPWQDRPEAQEAVRMGEPLLVFLNGEELLLPAKPVGEGHYLMEVLPYSGIDFGQLERPVELLVNDQPGQFSQKLANGDVIIIRYKEV